VDEPRPNPEFWSAVVGLSSAFVIAAAVQVAATGPFLKWSYWASLSFIGPGGVALYALVQLAKRRPATQSVALIAFMGMALIVAAAALLQKARP
jgi:hypothetical protein